MSLQCVKANSLAGKMMRELLSEADPIYLIDVGASGGIEEHWSTFGTKLRADGFDPLTTEVDTLNSATPNNETYWDAFIDGGNLRRSVVSPNSEDVSLTAFERTTASEYRNIKHQDYVKDVFNRGDDLRYTSNRYSLDEFLLAHGKPNPNFLKVDTDGSDFLVLQGAHQTLSNLNCLGVQVECQFHGRPDQHGNTFSNIDILLRSHGFRLFELETWRYSRMEFPSQFVYELAGQTIDGGIQWGEALYIRDPITNAQFQSFLNQDPNMMLKFLSIAVTMGQYDLAASTVAEFPGQGSKEQTISLMKVLDLMTIDQYPDMATYTELVEAFKTAPDWHDPLQWVRVI